MQPGEWEEGEEIVEGRRGGHANSAEREEGEEEVEEEPLSGATLVGRPTRLTRSTITAAEDDRLRRTQMSSPR